MGGEKRCTTSSAPVLPGSPPRGRGKGRTIKTIAAFTRITPAWAGKRAFSFSLALALQDHPRVGGEKYVDCRCEGGAIGSPPRGRGKEILPPGKLPRPRITPAWAGKRNHFSTDFVPKGDHPRVGGEKLCSSARICSTPGSPPRGRGKVCMATGLRVSDGITPAWAGKSARLFSTAQNPKDHPRVGGEKHSWLSVGTSL